MIVWMNGKSLYELCEKLQMFCMPKTTGVMVFIAVNEFSSGRFRVLNVGVTMTSVDLLSIVLNELLSWKLCYSMYENFSIKVNIHVGLCI